MCDTVTVGFPKTSQPSRILRNAGFAITEALVSGVILTIAGLALLRFLSSLFSGLEHAQIDSSYEELRTLIRTRLNCKNTAFQGVGSCTVGTYIDGYDNAGVKFIDSGGTKFGEQFRVKIKCMAGDERQILVEAARFESSSATAVFSKDPVSAQPHSWKDLFKGIPIECQDDPVCVPGSQTFSAAGTFPFVVPPGCDTLVVKAWGGGGGGSGSEDSTDPGGTGGGAGYAGSTLTVVSAETLTIDIGSAGGGGAGNVNSVGQGGGGGGGCTRITRGATRLIVASGGGGGGGAGESKDGSNGGVGGGSGGTAASIGGQGENGANGGSGGTSSSGGAGGTGSVNGANGIQDQGGAGATGSGGGVGGIAGIPGGGLAGTGATSDGGGGGGGGCGYFGGGGGGHDTQDGGGGGGGGSSYGSGTATVLTAGSGQDAGNKTDSAYASSGAGRGGDAGANSSGLPGSPGRMVLQWSNPDGI